MSQSNSQDSVAFYHLRGEVPGGGGGGGGLGVLPIMEYLFQASGI